MGLKRIRKLSYPLGVTFLTVMAFVALMLPIVTPGLNPELIGAHPSHGHLTIDGIVQEHTHDLTESANGDLVFTADDSGSSGTGLVIVRPATDRLTPSGEMIRIALLEPVSPVEWSPVPMLRPPRLSA